ncbi:MAG: 2OG-Fe(II) oxygenase [Bdellovibrionota bacterium]
MTMKPVRDYRSGKKTILVVDGLYSKQAIRKIHQALPGLKLPHGRSRNDILTDLDTSAFLERSPTASVYDHLSPVLRKHFPKATGHQVTNVVLNSIVPKLRPTLHRDSRFCERCLTCLYYANETWEGDWGGETVFYNEDRDAVFCVTPKPGRVVIFNDVLHRASPPVGAPGPRLSIALSYRCSHPALLALSKAGK